MERTFEVFIISVTLRVIIVAIIRGLHFTLSMRNLGNMEMNAATHDVRRLPLRAATCARSSCGIVHTGISVVIGNMGEFSLEYLRSSFHHIWILLQRRTGLGYGGALL